MDTNWSGSVLKRYGIWLVLTTYAVLASTYSIVTPIMEASDELWHYPMAKFVADHWALPVQEPGVETPWRQEGSQPPLYYIIGAAVTFWVDTSDMPEVRWINPHADNGIIRPDGNTNLIVHTPKEQFPWRGTSLAIHLIRFASVGMGAGTVYLTYLLTRELWPERQVLALCAASITAFNPMFCFISGSVNNDNLAMLLGAAGIWLLVRLVRRHCGSSAELRALWWRDAVILGVVLGMAVLTKSSAAGLLALTALAVCYVAWRRRSLWHLITGGSVTAGLVLVIAGWWFVRNAALYGGDWTGINRFVEVLGYRDPPATLRQLWGERYGFMMAYWGLFGGVNVPLPRWVYSVLNGAVLAAGAGLVVAAVRAIRDAWRERTVLDGGACIAGHQVQMVLVVLWPLLVAVPWLSWAMRTWSSQGRLVFAALSAWSTWMAFGLASLLPRRWSDLLPSVLSVFLLVVAAWAPLGVITPAYRPDLLPSDTERAWQNVLRADLGGQLRLLGYDISTRTVRPGESVEFALYWEAQRDMDHDWSVFCHVLDAQTGLPLATRDRYPAQGLLATRLMQPGQRWVDRYVVGLPETAYAPNDLSLEIGLYDEVSGERPPVLVEDGMGASVVDNALRFERVRLEPRPGDLPNPVRVNFGDQMSLVGWDLDHRVAAPGETVHLTLYWDCTAKMSHDYSVFTQVLDASDHKWAQWDSWPANTATSSWQVGQMVEDHYDLVLDADTPPGAKALRIGVYRLDRDGLPERVRIVNEEGRVMPTDYWTLDQLRVSGQVP